MAGDAQPRLVLASASPRRLAMLRQLGIEPAIIVPVDADESVGPREIPRLHAKRLARLKVESAAVAFPGDFVIAADTVVGLGRRILPKAETDETVRNCLRLLSGRRHRVYTAIALATPGTRLRERFGVAAVGFKRLTSDEIESYVRSGEGIGKAGGYAVQGLAAAFIDFISGSYSAVVGLPLHETATLLTAAGYKFLP